MAHTAVNQDAQYGVDIVRDFRRRQFDVGHGCACASQPLLNQFGDGRVIRGVFKRVRRLSEHIGFQVPALTP